MRLSRSAVVGIALLVLVALLHLVPKVPIVEANPASAPTLYSPGNNTATLNPMPRFEWTLVEGAEGYRLVVNTQPDFSGHNVIDVILDNTENFYTVPFEKRFAQDNYWWRVASIEIGVENWSDSWRLEVLEENTVIIYVDEATWIERFDGPNLVTNESFESGVNVDAENWTESGAAKRQPWANRTGSWGMAMCDWITGGTGEAYQGVSVTGGKEYIYKIWACRDPGDLTGTFYMKLAWYKDGGATYICENSQNITVGIGWDEKILTAVAPENADTVRVIIGSSGVNRTGKFDDVEFKTGSRNRNDDWRLGISGISNYERYSYLKFDLSDVPPGYWIKSARLYAYYSYGGFKGDNIAVHVQENDEWTDGTLSWNTSPIPRYGDYISENYVPSENGWVSWDVRSWVDEQYHEDGIASMVILTPDATEFWLVSDNDSEHPYLEVTYQYFGVPILRSPKNGATTLKTPTFVWSPAVNVDNHRLLVDDDSDFSSPVENRLLGPLESSYKIPLSDSLPLGTYYWKVVGIKEDLEMESQTWTFTVASKVTEKLYPTHDAKVENYSPNTNYGSETHIAVAGPHPEWYRRSFLKFDLSEAPEGVVITKALLFLYKYDDGGIEDTNRNIGVYSVDNDNWGESTITWNNQPPIGSLENYVYTSTSKDLWESWDISSWASDQYMTDNILSIALKMVDERNDWNSAEPFYYSKERHGTVYDPYLEVTYGWVGEPTLLSPENTYVTHDNTPTFSWIVGEKAENHRILIYDSPTFQHPKVEVVLGPTDNTYVVPDDSALEFGFLYYWKVVAIRDDVSVSSDIWTFTVTSAPLLSSVNFTLENGARIMNRTPTFSWTPGPLATSQRLVVSDAPDFSRKNLDVLLGPTESSYRVPIENALSPGTYWWKVAAIGSENWSEVWMFEIVEVAFEVLSSSEDANAIRNSDWAQWADGNKEFLFTGSWNDGLIFLKFNLSSLPQGGVVTEAELRLYCADLSGRGHVVAYEQDNDNWSELTLNRYNYPQSWGGAIYSARLWSPRWVSWISTEWVDKQYRGDGVVSFTLKYRGTDDPQSAKFWSKEYNDNAYHPYLLVKVEFLGAPTLISPTSGATTGRTPTFVWSPGKGAENHRLLVDNDPGFTSPEIDVTLGPSVGSYSLSTDEGLDYGVSYYWKVIAMREGVERESSTCSFKVEATQVTYTLVVLVNPPGSGSATPSYGVYEEGTLVDVEALPASGYEFDCWSGDASGTDSVIVIRMDSDKRIVANFKLVESMFPAPPRSSAEEQTGQVVLIVALAIIGGAVLIIVKFLLLKPHD